MNAKSEKDSRAPAAGSPLHTSGPWEAVHEKTYLHDTDFWGVYANHASIGHRMPAECHGPDAKANAKLIAAAPTLAAALTAIANEFGESGRNLAWARLHARAALRAAGLDPYAAPNEPTP